MLNEQDEKNVRRKLEFFLNKIVSVRYPEINHIIVEIESYPFKTFEYSIYVNPNFEGLKKIKDEPDYQDKLFKYIRAGSDAGIRMFNYDSHFSYYFKKIDWFWD